MRNRARAGDRRQAWHGVRAPYFFFFASEREEHSPWAMKTSLHALLLCCAGRSDRMHGISHSRSAFVRENGVLKTCCFSVFPASEAPYIAPVMAAKARKSFASLHRHRNRVGTRAGWKWTRALYEYHKRFGGVALWEHIGPRCAPLGRRWSL